MNRLSLPTIAGLAAMLLCWTMTPLAITYVKEHFSLLFQIWLRYFSSFVFLWVLASRQKDFRKDVAAALRHKGRFLLMTISAALLTLGFQLLYTYCFFLVTPTFGILLYESQVLFALLWGMIFFQSERHLMKQPGIIAGILMAVAGAAAVIIFRSGGITVDVNIGILMALGAAVCWSFLGVVLNKGGSGTTFSPLFVIATVFTLVVIFLGPVLFFTGAPHITEPEGSHWFVLIGSGMLGIAAGQGIYYSLLPKTGIVVIASVQLLVPLLTGIASFLLFAERLTVLQLVGGAVLLSGAQLILKQKAKDSLGQD